MENLDISGDTFYKISAWICLYILAWILLPWTWDKFQLVLVCLSMKDDYWLDFSKTLGIGLGIIRQMTWKHYFGLMSPQNSGQIIALNLLASFVHGCNTILGAILAWFLI